MSEQYRDPITDPLTPFWRAKVEAAFRGDPMPRVTEREAEICALVERRGSQAAAARALGIHPSTVFKALRSARRKREGFE